VSGGFSRVGEVQMRWIFLSLIFCNVLYFGWQQWIQFQDAPSVQYYQSSDTVRGAPKVKLLSESKRPLVALPNQTIVVDVAPSRLPPKSPALSRSSVCQVLGPFLERSKAQLLYSELEVDGIVSALLEKEVVVESKYWVYLPPLSTKEGALKQLKGLQSKKIDSFLISRGELKNGISLGIFSSADSANGLLVRLEATGIGASVKKTDKFETQFWIRVEENSLSGKAKILYQERIEQLSGIKVAQSAC